MDVTAPEIKFSRSGCTFCTLAKKMKPTDKTLPEIPKGQKYDVLMGLSGGVDSSTALVKVVELGLRPLCYSIDNGWQTKEAQENIMRLVEGLKVPFFRYNINLKRFAELQSAFLHAGLINAEIPSDHILLASSYELASKYGIKTIISGGNWSTESIMPFSWSYPARDLVHIKDVFSKVMDKKLRGLPVCGLLKFNYYKWLRRIKTINLLDYYAYNRAESIKMLEEKFGYKPYGAKHEESLFTSWFQNFYLYEKFGIDKRKAHLSSLIVSGQITREEAIAELTKAPVYPQIGLEEKVMGYTKGRHENYKTDLKRWTYITTSIRALKRLLRRLTPTGKTTRG